MLKIPKFLQPKKIKSLVRVGKHNDGGYLVDPRSIEVTDFLLTFGISDDWSFEQQFLQSKTVPLVSFDGSVGFKFFLKKTVKKLWSLSFISFVRMFLACIKYKMFFSDDRCHIVKHVGFDQSPKIISLKRIVQDFLPMDTKNIFIKMDIEGWEYRILDSLLELAKSDRISGFVVEFHDIDLHLDKLEKFIKEFPLNLCHFHYNNHSLLTDSDLPLVIELSFTKFAVEDELVTSFPHHLDMPCRKRGKSINEVEFI